MPEQNSATPQLTELYERYVEPRSSNAACAVHAGAFYLASTESAFCGISLCERWDLLDDGERIRARRFRFESDRRDYVAAHALLRLALSRTAPIDPAQWLFVADANGKPMVAGPTHGAAVAISLSHTRGIVACGIGSGIAVGVDVERIRQIDRSVELAREFFSPREVNALERLDSGSRCRRFLELWTLKESYAKAVGLGLRMPLHATSFDILEGNVVRCTSSDKAANTDGWQFGIRVSPNAYVLGFAVGQTTFTGRNEPLVVTDEITMSIGSKILVVKLS